MKCDRNKHSNLLATLVAICLLARAGAISRDDLYPFGVNEGDAQLPVGDDESSAEITLAEDFVYFGARETAVYVSWCM